MSNSGSTISYNEQTNYNVIGDTLQIPGYHFKSAPTTCLVHGENIDIIYGYRISNKKPVVAKVSPNSLRLEREFYIMKRLYQLTDGPSYLVRPLEYLNLPSGLTVVIYADEGQNHFEKRRYSDETGKNHSDQTSLHSGNSTDPGAPAGVSTLEPTYDLSTFLRFAIKCTDCLEFIHRHNIVHGEIRLSAFQWTGEDRSRVKLWNFGSGSKSLENYLTSEGWRKTANNKDSVNMLQKILVFMSPEQTGRTTYTPDHRSDIYSLGVVFFVLLTGRSPFDGGPLDIINSVLSRKMPLVNDIQFNIPEVIARIIEKMTNKSPDDRYTSAYGINSDLKECLKRLKSSSESSTESVGMFPLAEHDIASVFTLPKHVYGRQSMIVEMTFIIHRVSGVYKCLRHRERSYATSSSYPTTDMHPSNNSTIESTESVSIPDVVSITGGKSNATPSYCSGLDGSDVSSTTGRGASKSHKQGTEIIAVYGPGGIGKSTLLSAVQNVARQSSYVAMTKFDSRHKVPYGCILRSLSQILQQILSESGDEIDEFYKHLQKSLGPQFCNVELLANLVPELKPLLEPKTVDTKESFQVIHLDNVETRVRFHNLFVEVFRALTHWRMITLFLDDLHQADDPSLELIQSLVASRVKMLLLVSYRDQEITEKLENILKCDLATVHYMKIDALEFDSLLEYVGDALHRPRDTGRESVLPLAEIVYKKTRGNTFYTAQLLLALEKKKLIFFNWDENEWDYNIADINQAIMSPDDSNRDAELDIGFLVSRLRELPLDGQRLLKWASFVGDTFSWNTVKHLMVSSDQESDISDPESEVEESRKSLDVARPIHPVHSFSTVPSSENSSSSSNKDQPKKHSNGSWKKDPINGLQAAIQEGYILPLESDEFKWTHDRYSQAAMELANPKTREKIHFKISQYLIQEKKVDCFLVSDHLLKCIDLVSGTQDKDKYMKIFMSSGNKARSSGAHTMAFGYYMGAIKLLGDDPWKEETYAVTHYLYINAVSLSWVVGEYEHTEKLLDQVFKHATSSLDRVTAYRIKHKYFFARQRHLEACGALHQCLSELGADKIEGGNTRETLAREFNIVKALIDEKGIEKVMQIPSCEDPKLKAIMGILEELCTVAYWLGNQTDMFYLACRVVHLSLTEGMTSVSGIGMAFMGICAVQAFDMFEYGEELGAAGVSITETHGNNGEKGRCIFLYSNFLLQWKYHYKESLTWYRSSLRLSLSGGERIYASFSQLHIATTMFFVGDNLSECLREAEICYDDIHNWSSSVDSNILIMSVIRTIKSLQGHTFNENPNEIFDGDDGFNDEHFIIESCKQSANPAVPMNWYDCFRMIPLVLYGHYTKAIEVGCSMLKGIHNHPLHRHTRLMMTFLSLAILEKLRSESVTPEERSTLLDRVHKNQISLNLWSTHSVVNYHMWYVLVDAELAAFENDFCKASHLYEEAINLAREGGWYLELSIAHEYTGGFYKRSGLNNVAYGFIRKAIELYVNHGSYGKARHLGIKFNELLSAYDDNRHESQDVGIQTDPIPFMGPHNSWSTSSLENINPVNEPYDSETIPPVTTEQTLLTLDILDMASILKSSQVMSSEVKFDSLLKSMMSIILENSGADCGAIIVKEERFGVCAYGSQQEGSMTFDSPRPLSDDDDLISSRIINHTINTAESIFVHDIESDPRFAVGPWFERAGTKSVICMPIIHKGSLVGCLFIEGSSGIFTQRHVTVLSLLCQQMGISITNAFLFKSVQRVTMSNMRMIENQKQALEDARKSKEAAVRATRLREIFLANMSHEIRTPFSGFYGMISLLSETKLDAEQSDLVRTAKESCEILLQIIDDLLNFSKLQAGKVSLDISPVVLEDIIVDVVEMLVAMAIQKEIYVSYQVDDDVPPVVMADGNRLRQIFINLLGNAIKFTHEGEISIRCSINKKKPHSKFDDKVDILFEVIDSGIGISEDQRKVLFVPFSQVDGSTTRKYGGTGLGLSICLQLVQLMSGFIDVSSVPGKGSNFFFTVKLSKARDQDGKLLLPGYFKEMDENLRAIRHVKILVAGKYESTITMIRHMLPSVLVDGVNSVEKLSQRLISTQYDIIVLGLFLTKEFMESKGWIEDIIKNIKHGTLIIMNYPSGIVSEIHQRGQWVEPISKTLPPECVRMAVPLRRKKLIQIIADIMNNHSPRRNMKVIKPKGSDLVTEEEREIYKTMHILVAEDNPVAQKLLFKQLTRFGFQVKCANNGSEAVEAWTNHPDGYFTMGFFDHHMPKVNILHKSIPHTNFVILSAME
ncbi:hypothetical protein CLU79DRAFT_703166 [Phycomyces nitens]|nr:hypothetical protein CLU79DRAFT_703166 [Phycomyces nitens]